MSKDEVHYFCVLVASSVNACRTTCVKKNLRELADPIVNYRRVMTYVCPENHNRLIE